MLLKSTAQRKAQKYGGRVSGTSAAFSTEDSANRFAGYLQERGIVTAPRAGDAGWIVDFPEVVTAGVAEALQSLGVAESVGV